MSINIIYETFKDAVAALAGDGAFAQRVGEAQAILARLGGSSPVFDQALLQSRFEDLMSTNAADDPGRSAREILMLFEEVNAVYHIWMSQAGRSC